MTVKRSRAAGLLVAGDAARAEGKITNDETPALAREIIQLDWQNPLKEFLRTLYTTAHGVTTPDGGKMLEKLHVSQVSHWIVTDLTFHEPREGDEIIATYGRTWNGSNDCWLRIRQDRCPVLYCPRDAAADTVYCYLHRILEEGGS